MRRAAAAVLIAVLGLAACRKPLIESDDRTPPLNTALLEEQVGRIAAREPGVTVGAAIQNLTSGERWSLNGERPFPLGGLAALPVAAAALAEEDAGRLSPGEIQIVEPTDLTPPPSSLAETWPARDRFTVGELLDTALAHDDTLALDLVTRKVGGPGAVTGWLRLKSVKGLSVDRYQREIGTERLGLTPFRPAWRGEAAFARAAGAVPPAQRQAAAARYLADPRDTATPSAAVKFMADLSEGALVSRPAYARLLARLPVRTDDRALPKGARFTGRRSESATGTGEPGASGEIGVVTLADGRPYAIAVFVSGSGPDQAGRAAPLDDTRRALIQAAR